MKNIPVIGDLSLTKIGDRLRVVDRFVIEILKQRMANGRLSDWVAENKSRGTDTGVYPIRRMEVEDKRIALMRKWAKESGLNQNFAGKLMYDIMTESCLVQDRYMVDGVIHNSREKKQHSDEKDEDKLFSIFRQNLLALTEIVAENYDYGYGEDCFGTNIHVKFSRKKLQNIIASLPERKLAIDLGCATGITSFEISEQFEQVLGYDISPHMIQMANNKKDDSRQNVEFIVHDLENGFTLPKDSVSLVIMNMGTASDIKNIKKVLASIKECLHPDGKFFLSFYNSQSLVQSLGFLPWPMPLAAYADHDRKCLEVFVGDKIFFIYARPRSAEEVRALLDEDFVIDQLITYPSLASVIPQVLLYNEDDSEQVSPKGEAMDMIKKIDRLLADSDIHTGTYIMVTGGKK